MNALYHSAISFSHGLEDFERPFRRFRQSMDGRQGLMNQEANENDEPDKHHHGVFG